MASFLYECFFQFIKHFLKSRSYKDLAFLFRKKKRLLNNCWVSGTHLVLPWCLHTDFQASLSYISNDGESELLSWLPHTSRTRQRHTSSLAQHCSQALSTYKDAKWYSQGSTSPQRFQTFPLLSHPVLCSTEYNPPVSVSHFRTPVALWSPSSGSQQWKSVFLRECSVESGCSLIVRSWRRH